MDTRCSTLATREAFDDVVLPHLQSAYNLARWLVRNNDDAQDIVQEASLRAFRHFDQFRGGDAHAWLLTIVRNTCYGWHRKNRPAQRHETLDDYLETHAGDREAPDPERLLLQHADTELVGEAVALLSARFREVFVLRELEGLSYKEIADAMNVPIGTVMSSLSRARSHFRQAVGDLMARNAAAGSSASLP
jgi:RNA polymerase sigma-70 factor (ECF subfamily)